eukprot:GGOE01042995.1.p1 GENE.GGOE01042995.1~~GGOE01042995.1.p1  ORF type:complete len:366 (+),score=87.68 GGOE01042995.1:111-1208(+)
MDLPADTMTVWQGLHGPLARLQTWLASPWGRRLRRGALLAALVALLWKTSRRVLQNEAACQQSEAEFQKCCERASHQLLSMLPPLLDRCNVHAHFARLKEAHDRDAKVQQWQVVKLETFASLLLLGYSLAVLQAVTLVGNAVQHLARQPSAEMPADMMQMLMTCLLPGIDHAPEAPLFSGEHFLSDGIAALRMAITASIAPEINELPLRDHISVDRLLALLDEARMRFELNSPNISTYALVAGLSDDNDLSAAHEAFQDVVEHPNFRQMLRHVEDAVFKHISGYIRAAFDQARQTHRGDGSPTSVGVAAGCAMGEETGLEESAPTKALVCVLPRLAFVPSRVLEDRGPVPPSTLLQFASALQMRR